MKMTPDEYENEILSKDISHIPLEPFINKTTKIKHLCPNDHEFFATPSHILQGKGCNICNPRKAKTSQVYNTEIKLLGYTTLDPYVNNKTKILHKHLTCGHTWLVRPNDIITGYGCPMCNPSKKKTMAQYITQVSSDFRVEEEYKGALVPIMHTHIPCGTTRKIRPSDMLVRDGRTKCPTCTNYGINLTEPTTLYFIELNYANNIYYKVGITNKIDVKDRFRGEWDTYAMKLLWHIRYDTGRQAKAVEQEILATALHSKEKLPIKGYTEILCEFISKPPYVLEAVYAA